MSIEKHINNSHPLKFQDLDMELAAEIGITDAEKVILSYIADVEGQTIYYMREMLGTKIAEDTAAVTFMTIWNYEEFFHSHAVDKFLQACGVDLGATRRENVRMGAQFAAKSEAVIQWIMGRIIPSTFNALYLAWAASQEYLTRIAYERVAATTQNPVLKELCTRIAKQERRHFAWYFNCAKRDLAESKFTRRVVRFIFKNFWSPVGVGVKSKAEARELVHCLFPGRVLDEVMEQVDSKIAQLPGLEDIGFARDYADGLMAGAPMLPEPSV